MESTMERLGFDILIEWKWHFGNGLTQTTNRYYDFDATFMCSVIEEKYNLWLRFPTISRVSMITLRFYEDSVCV